MEPRACIKSLHTGRTAKFLWATFISSFKAYLLKEEDRLGAASSKLGEYFCKRKATPSYVFVSEFELK
jgi:hypothetical protein